MIDLKHKLCLATGGLGLLGRPLVELLKAEGAYVRVLDILPWQPDLSVAADEYWPGDLNKDGLSTVLYGVHYVFHLAGAKGGVGIGRIKAADFLTANLQPTINLFNGIKGNLQSEHKSIERVLFVSSVGAYSGDMQIFREDKAWDGLPHQSDFYGGMSKRFGEVLCRAYREQFGLDYVVVRPTNCYGPFDRFDAETGMVIAALIARLEAGERPLILKGNPGAMRDFLYSKECARGILLAMKNGRSGEIYNLGTGKPEPIINIAQQLARFYGTQVKVEQSADTSPAIRCMDMSKSKKELGFCPQSKTSDFLEETVSWYKQNKNRVAYDPF